MNDYSATTKEAEVCVVTLIKSASILLEKGELKLVIGEEATVDQLPLNGSVFQTTGVK